MEYIIVRFRESRDVVVDGVLLGKVGNVLRVNPGRHKISLSGDPNYTPSFRLPDIRGTTPITPMEVSFA